MNLIYRKDKGPYEDKTIGITGQEHDANLKAFEDNITSIADSVSLFSAANEAEMTAEWNRRNTLGGADAPIDGKAEVYREDLKEFWKWDSSTTEKAVTTGRKLVEVKKAWNETNDNDPASMKATDDEIDAKISAIPRDATPTKNSTNAPQSGGTFEALRLKQEVVSGNANNIDADDYIQNGALNASGVFSAHPNWRTIVNYPIVAAKKIWISGIESGSKYGAWIDSSDVVLSTFTVLPNTIYTAPTNTAKVSVTLVGGADTAGDVDYVFLIGDNDSDFKLEKINGLPLKDTELSSDVATNASDISTNASNIASNDADILALQNKENLLINLSDAYNHSIRTKALSVDAKEVEILDEFINNNKDSYFAFKPLSVGVDKVCVQIPDNNANDGEITRSGTGATYTDKFGVIRDALENEARLDYSKGKPMLLAEETSENLYKNSLFVGAISGTNGTGTLPTNLIGSNNQNITVLPSIYENGNALLLESISNRSTVSLAIPVTSGNTYCASAKITILEGSAMAREFFRALDVNFVTTETFYINGVEIADTDIIAEGTYDVKIVIVATGNGTSDFRLGAGCTSDITAKVIVDVPQFELGEVRTSFIPTNTTTAKTRSLDNYSDFGVDFTNKEGIINLKVADISKDGISNIDFSNGTNNERVRFRFNYSISTALRVEIYTGNVQIGVLSTNDFDLSEENLISLQLRSGDYKLAANGVVLDADETIEGLPQLTKFDLHSANTSGASPFQGFVEEITIKPITGNEFYSDLINVTLTTDSITEQGYWQPYVIKEFSQCKFTNNAIGGTTISNVNANSLSNPTRIATLDANSDFVTIMGFTNDFSQNVPLGAITDSVDTTAYGGLIKAIERIVVQCPNAEIILMTPIYKVGESTTNTQGLTLEDYRQCMREVARIYHLKLIEMVYCGINQWNSSTTIPDGTHPREEGGKLMAKTFIKEFTQLVILNS